MKKLLRIVENNKATKWQRFAHFIIDRVVVYLIFVIFGFLCALTYKIFGTTYFVNIAYNLSSVGKLMDIVITSTVYFFYVLLMEYFTKGRTVGKYLTGCKVIATDGIEPSFQDYFIRNLYRLIPFDSLSFLGKNGWHDDWSDTRVINYKNYKAEIQAKSEIESLGAKEIA